MQLIGAIDCNREAAIVSDVTEWTNDTEKWVKIHRMRYADQPKEKGNQYEVGFSLGLYLEDSTDIKDLVSLVIADESIENDFCNGRDDLSQSLKEVKSSMIENTPSPSNVPPDSLMQKMDSIFSKKLKNVSIDQYYSVGWSEETPLYGPWLEKKGSFEVSVSNWEHSDEGFAHAWSGETFPQRRVSLYVFRSF